MSFGLAEVNLCTGIVEEFIKWLSKNGYTITQYGDSVIVDHVLGEWRAFLRKELK